MTNEKAMVQTFGYRRGENGEVEKRIFDVPEDDMTIPPGWHDSPANVDDGKDPPRDGEEPPQAPEPEPETPRRGPGRPRKQEA